MKYENLNIGDFVIWKYKSSLREPQYYLGFVVIQLAREFSLRYVIQLFDPFLIKKLGNQISLPRFEFVRKIL